MPDGLPEDAHQFVVGKDIERIGHAHQQFTTLLGQNNTAEPSCHRLRQFFYQLVIELVMTQLHKGHIQLPGQDIEQAVLVDIAKIGQGLAQLTAGAFLFTQGRHQLLLSNDTILNQEVT